jgi:hypothetical protein
MLSWRSIPGARRTGLSKLFSIDQELLDASAKYFKADAEHTPTLSTSPTTTSPSKWPLSSSKSTPRSGWGHPALSSEEFADAAAVHEQAATLETA